MGSCAISEDAKRRKNMEIYLNIEALYIERKINTSDYLRIKLIKYEVKLIG